MNHTTAIKGIGPTFIFDTAKKDCGSPVMFFALEIRRIIARVIIIIPSVAMNGGSPPS